MQINELVEGWPGDAQQPGGLGLVPAGFNQGLEDIRWLQGGYFKALRRGRGLLDRCLLILGNGFFKPNISPQVGNLYAPGDHRRDRAFSVFYVGITRAQRSLAVSWTRKRKKGREMIAAQPSRFIAEMGLDQATVKEDPREKLRALRAEFAQKALDGEAARALVR